MDNNDTKKGVKRQEIALGVIMEKYQEKEKDKNYYFIKIELQLFNRLDFTVDFSGSANVQLEGSPNLIKHTVIEPFTKVVVAKLLLEKNWSLKIKFDFSTQLPPIETQQKHMTPILANLNEEIKMTQDLKDIDCVGMPDKELFAKLEANDWHFVDHEFPPTTKSLTEGQKDFIADYGCIVHWRRAKFIALTSQECANVKAVPYIYFEGINPFDVKQGKLQDSWLLSGISIIAENEKLVKRVILTKNPNDYGVYKLKLCRMGIWKTLVVDDFFPCFPMSDPIFNRNNSKEIWVMLVEKAFAKLHGNYMLLENGNIKESLVDLTGCPVFTYSMNVKDQEIPFAPEDLWNKIKQWSADNYLVAATTREISTENSIVGLAKEHAYCILRTVELTNNVQIINIRNPWGVFDWTGDWSKASPLWTEDIKNRVKPNFEEDDKSFWMSYKHFIENFGVVNVCMTKGWHELKLKGKFTKSVDEDTKTIEHFSSRWFYQLDVSKPSKVILGLHQEDQRSLGVKLTRPYVDIGLMVASYNDGLYKIIKYIDTDFVRECFLEVDLEPGTYYVIPRSLGVNLCSHDVEENASKNYTSEDFEMVSVMKDIFEKHDVSSQGFLTYNEMKAFYKFLEKDLSQAEYNSMISKYGGNNSSSASKGITERNFIDVFSNIIRSSERSYIQKVLHKLGYTNNLFSYRTRLYRLTVHSSNPVNVFNKDAFKESIDFIANKLLIKKFGKNIQDNMDAKSSDSEIYGLYYFNRFINKQDS